MLRNSIVVILLLILGVNMDPMIAAAAVSPAVSMSGDSGLGEALSSMGADVSRAIAAGQTSAERQLQALAMEKAGLENDFLRSQIASINSRTMRESAPPFPGALPEKSVDPTHTTGINIGSFFPPWESHPNFSDAGQYGENRYGEFLGNATGAPAAVADAWWNSTLRKAIMDVQSTRPGARSAFDYIYESLF